MAKWKSRKQMSILGTYYSRVDAADKLTGKAKYTYDQFPSGMLYGAILGSPYPAAKILKIDDQKVARLPGVSYAFFEERLLDPLTGTMINPNFENYKIIGTMETPEIEIVLYDEPERGVIGIGELPTIPTAGAIANAVYNVIGKRIHQLPMTPDKILTALVT